MSDGGTPSESATGKAARKESSRRFSAEEESGISEELDAIPDELESGTVKLSEPVSDELEETFSADNAAEDIFSDELETPARELEETTAEESAVFVSSSNSANKSRTCANEGAKRNKTQKAVTKKRILRIYKKTR